MIKLRANENLSLGDDRRRLRIAISIWMFKPGTGGLQSHAECLARHLMLRGHEVTVFTRAYTRVPENMDFLYMREARQDGLVNGVPVRVINYARCLRPVQWLIAKLKDRPRFRKISIQLYHLQSSLGNAELFAGFDLVHHVGQANAFVGFAAASGARRNGVPFVVQPTCHPRNVGDDPADIDLYRHAQRVLVHTAYEADYLRPYLPEHPIDVVGNGVEDRSDGDADSFRRKCAIDGPFILYIGRRDQDKGYPLVVEAFRHLRNRCVDVKLVCMGPAGGVPVIECDGLTHFDFVDEQTKHDALAACTCLCVPSEGESFGLVYMEAGRYAKPVVARRLPVLVELLKGGQAGLLLGEMDVGKNVNHLSAVELADSLANLIDDPAHARRLGEECRNASEAFVWERIVQRFESSYYSAIEHRI